MRTTIFWGVFLALCAILCQAKSSKSTTKAGKIESTTHEEKNEVETTKIPIPGSLGRYFVYINCKECKIKSDLVLKVNSGQGNETTTGRSENDSDVKTQETESSSDTSEADQDIESTEEADITDSSADEAEEEEGNESTDEAGEEEGSESNDEAGEEEGSESTDEAGEDEGSESNDEAGEEESTEETDNEDHDSAETEAEKVIKLIKVPKSPKKASRPFYLRPTKKSGSSQQKENRGQKKTLKCERFNIDKANVVSGRISDAGHEKKCVAKRKVVAEIFDESENTQSSEAEDVSETEEFPEEDEESVEEECEEECGEDGEEEVEEDGTGEMEKAPEKENGNSKDHEDQYDESVKENTYTGVSDYESEELKTTRNEKKCKCKTTKKKVTTLSGSTKPMQSKHKKLTAKYVKQSKLDKFSKQGQKDSKGNQNHIRTIREHVLKTDIIKPNSKNEEVNNRIISSLKLRPTKSSRVTKQLDSENHTKKKDKEKMEETANVTKIMRRILGCDGSVCVEKDLDVEHIWTPEGSREKVKEPLTTGYEM